MKRVFLPLCLAALLLLSACREAEAGDAKPVIYLYPEEETEVTVRLDYDGTLTCTYPAYEDGWTVTAAPDGTLRDESGQTYSYLYWEGVTRTEYNFSRGFCVPGADTAAFLEDALSRLGLTRRESVAARWDAAVRKMLTLRFHMMSDYREMDRAIEIFATYPRDLAPLVTHIAPLDDWERLFDILTRGGGIKGVLNVDGTVRNPV